MKERFVERLENYQFTYITLKIHPDVLNAVSPFFLFCAFVLLLRSKEIDLLKPRSRSFFRE
jgi:hypothetical protein